jgi:hypothetical protein
MADARVAFEIMQEFAFAHGPLLAEVKRSGKNPGAVTQWQYKAPP